MASPAFGLDRERVQARSRSIGDVAEAVGVSKRFGPTVALSDVSLRVVAGESHALVGRNGAGKSTLVAILTGMIPPDDGTVNFAGEPAPPVADRSVWRRRVACVYQHSTIVPDLTVAENIFINRQPAHKGFILWPEMRRQARRLLDQWGVAVDADARAGDLNVEARQLVEIARALSYGARFIILDEPTAQLDGEEIKRLFRHMRELQASGITFLYISHHLQEIYEVCQAVTVLRDARRVLTGRVRDVSRLDLIGAMTGEGATAFRSARPAPSGTEQPVVLRLDRLGGDDFDDVNLSVRRGEIVGLAGSTSSGRIGAAEAVAGLGRFRSGSVTIDGHTVRSGDVADALELGIACVPRSRHKQGLVLGLSVADNATLAVGSRLGPFGLISPERKLQTTESTIRSLGIVTQGPRQPVSGLSGGNQQKLVMGRALASDPKVLVLIDPTAGVDIRSKDALLASVEAMRRKGMAILLVSSDLDDLRICDRVLVMRHGAIVTELAAGWSESVLVAEIEGIANS